MTAQPTISPPAASTAGIIASSEPPVVRMSSTSRTRSPGSIRKPRRNSRRGGPSPPLTSSAKIARVPSCRPGLEGEDHAAGRRAGDEVDRGLVGRAAVLAGPEAAQLAGRRGVGEHRELLEVGVGVAPALEEEVPVAEGAGAAGTAPRCGCAMAARAVIACACLIVVIGRECRRRAATRSRPAEPGRTDASARPGPARLGA